MTREEALTKNEEIHREAEGLWIAAAWTDGLITQIYADINDKKCTNCKHCDQVKETMGHSLIHCSYFEQYMPIEIGKCDMWEKKR